MTDPTQFSCFRIGSLARRLGRFWNSRLAEAGITFPQSWVLLCLLNRDGMSVKDLAATIQIDSSAVTGLVDRLVKEDRVFRQEDEADRRSLRIYLTEHGRRTASQAQAIALEIDGVFKKLTSDELSKLERVMDEFERKYHDVR